MLVVGRWLVVLGPSSVIYSTICVGPTWLGTPICSTTITWQSAGGTGAFTLGSVGSTLGGRLTTLGRWVVFLATGLLQSVFFSVCACAAVCFPAAIFVKSLLNFFQCFCHLVTCRNVALYGLCKLLCCGCHVGLRWDHQVCDVLVLEMHRIADPHCLCFCHVHTKALMVLHWCS